MSDRLTPQGGPEYTEGDDIGEDLSNQPINDDDSE